MVLEFVRSIKEELLPSERKPNIDDHRLLVHITSAVYSLHIQHQAHERMEYARQNVSLLQTLVLRDSIKQVYVLGIRRNTFHKHSLIFPLTVVSMCESRQDSEFDG